MKYMALNRKRKSCTTDEEKFENLLNNDLDKIKNLKRVDKFLHKHKNNRKNFTNMVESNKKLLSPLLYERYINSNSSDDVINTVFNLLYDISFMYNTSQFDDGIVSIVENFATSTHKLRNIAVPILANFYSDGLSDNYKKIVSLLLDQFSYSNLGLDYQDGIVSIILRIFTRAWKESFDDTELFWKIQLFILAFASKFNINPNVLVCICSCISHISRFEHEPNNSVFINQADHILIDILMNDNLHMRVFSISSIPSAIKSIMKNRNYSEGAYLWTCCPLFEKLFKTSKCREIAFQLLCINNDNFPIEFLKDRWKSLVNIFSNELITFLPSCISILILEYFHNKM